MINKLDRLRASMNNTDEKIVELLAKRRALSLEIAKEKQQTQIPLHVPQREEALLNRLCDKALQRKIPTSLVKNVYQQILKDSLSCQRDYIQRCHQEKKMLTCVSVAYSGHCNSTSSLVSAEFFHQRQQKYLDISCSNYTQVLDAVESGQALYGVLPIESTTSGIMHEIFDLLNHTWVHIIGEINYPNEYCLFTTPNTDLTNIHTLYTHPYAYQQCPDFLERLGPVEIVYCKSSTQAVQKVATLDCQEVAAIGSPAQGRHFSLTPLLQQSVQPQDGFSRFIVIAKKTHHPQTETQTAKTTLLCSIPHHNSNLADVLSLFKTHNIYISKIGSKPLQSNAWQDMFYLDVEAHQSSSAMQKVLQELSAITQTLKVLGCYPKEIRSHLN